MGSIDKVIARYILNPIQYACVIESIGEAFLKQSLDLSVYNERNWKVKKDVVKPRLIPEIGIKIIYDYLDATINNKIKWTKTGKRSIVDVIMPYVVQEYQGDTEVVELIEGIIYDLRREVEKFIGDDEWNVYFIRRVHNDIIIEKGCDYRIHWFEQNYKGG